MEVVIRVFQKRPKLEFDPIELGAVEGWYEDPTKQLLNYNAILLVAQEQCG